MNRRPAADQVAGETVRFFTPFDPDEARCGISAAPTESRGSELEGPALRRQANEFAAAVAATFQLEQFEICPMPGDYRLGVLHPTWTTATCSVRFFGAFSVDGWSILEDEEHGETRLVPPPAWFTQLRNEVLAQIAVEAIRQLNARGR